MPLSRTGRRFGCGGRGRRPRRGRRGHMRCGGVLSRPTLAADGAGGPGSTMRRRPCRLPRRDMGGSADDRMRCDVRRRPHDGVRGRCSAHDRVRWCRRPCRRMWRRVRRGMRGRRRLLAFVWLGLRQHSGRQDGAQNEGQYHRTGSCHEFLHTIGRAQPAVMELTMPVSPARRHVHGNVNGHERCFRFSGSMRQALPEPCDALRKMKIAGERARRRSILSSICGRGQRCVRCSRFGACRIGFAAGASGTRALPAAAPPRRSSSSAVG